VTHPYNTERLRSLYDNILNDNIHTLRAGGKTDPSLFNAKNDDRMSLVVLLRLSDEVSRNIADYSRNLSMIEPDLYIYPECDYHITVMDILKGAKGRLLPANTTDYISAIESCSADITKFCIGFHGLTASDNVIMVKGFYDAPLQIFRERLRTSLKSRGLSLEERYETVSCHVSIARISKPLSNPDELIDFIKLPHDFGVMTVDCMEISFHNWYDTQTTVLGNILLS
jgi:2'-5' RNA ligase